MSLLYESCLVFLTLAKYTIAFFNYVFYTLVWCLAPWNKNASLWPILCIISKLVSIVLFCFLCSFILLWLWHWNPWHWKNILKAWGVNANMLLRIYISCANSTLKLKSKTKAASTNLNVADFLKSTKLKDESHQTF